MTMHESIFVFSGILCDSAIDLTTQDDDLDDLNGRSLLMTNRMQLRDMLRHRLQDHGPDPLWPDEFMEGVCS